MNDKLLKKIISRILDNANDTLKENNDSFTIGKRLAYYEVLDSIKNDLVIENCNLQDYGLDFDIDKKYM